ncbi:hypothetical protein Tco_0642151 [Tanacetum coccineum]
MFDELLNLPSSVDHPSPEVIALIIEAVALEPAASTGLPSSTTVEQDVPSAKNDSEASSSSDVIPTIVHTAAPNSEHVTKWTKDHPLDNIIGELERPVSTRLQLYEQALFCYYDAFLSSVEPKTYKDALMISTDISKITRKPSKTDKHGHEERKSTKEARDAKPRAGSKVKKSTLVNSQSNLGQ